MHIWSTTGVHEPSHDDRTEAEARETSEQPGLSVSQGGGSSCRETWFTYANRALWSGETRRSLHHAAKGTGWIKILATAKPAFLDCRSTASARCSQTSNVSGSFSGSVNSLNNAA